MRAVPLLLGLAAIGCRYGFDDRVADDAADSGIIDPVTVPSATSGSRLRSQYADYGDGARDHLGWFDTLLGVPCKLDATSADGVRRCFPENPSNIVYADASCTTPLAVASTTGTLTPPAWARTLQTGSCAFVVRYASVGAQLALTEYYTDSSGACTGPFPATGSTRLYGVNPVTDDTFVAVENVRVGDGRLQATGWKASDGAIELDGLYDRVLGSACHVTETASGVHCVPAGPLQGTYFADASCTVGLVGVGACGDPPRYAIWSPPGCGATRAYEIGAAHTATAYRRTGSTCEPATPDVPVFAVGPELASSAMVAWTDAAEPTGGRLERHLLLGDDGSRRLLGWRDMQRGRETCSSSYGAALGDGARCMPTSLSASLGKFVDATCATPYAEIQPGCTADYVVAFDGRGLRYHAVDPGAPAPAAGYTWGTSCFASTVDATKTYVVGQSQAIPLDSFAGGPLAVE